MNISLLIILIVGVVLVLGLAVLFAVVDKLAKGEIKFKKSSEPKKEEKAKPEPVEQTAPNPEEKPVKEAAHDEKDEEEKDIENNVDIESGRNESHRSRRIREYYKKRWGDSPYSLLSSEEENTEDEPVISKEEAAKLIALRNLFDKK